MKTKSVFTGLAAAALLLSMPANAAIAGDHASGVTGSVARSSGTTIYSDDTADDDQWTRANWNARGGGEGGINNESGPNTTASTNTGHEITAVQACRSESYRPMFCSNWNNWH